MRKSSALALALGVLVAVTVLPVVPVQAHGGGLDWQGGHNCRVGSCAGTYHCHQPRGGICASQSQPAPTTRPNNPSLNETCITEEGKAERCSYGRTWTSSWCWDLEGAVGPVHLEKKVNGAWKRVQSDVAERDLSSCYAESPWATDLRVAESRIGTFEYRYKFPDGDTYAMKVIVS